MKEKLLSVLAIFPAIGAALCWGGGIILASLGLGTIGFSFFANLTKYKPIFVILTAVLLYYTYSLIEKRNADRKTRILFWISALVSVLIIYYPTILRWLSWLVRNIFSSKQKKPINIIYLLVSYFIFHILLGYLHHIPLICPCPLNALVLLKIP